MVSRCYWFCGIILEFFFLFYLIFEGACVGMVDLTMNLSSPVFFLLGKIFFINLTTLHPDHSLLPPLLPGPPLPPSPIFPSASRVPGKMSASPPCQGYQPTLAAGLSISSPTEARQESPARRKRSKDRQQSQRIIASY